MNKRILTLLAISVAACGCDLSSPVDSVPCSGNGEPLAGIVFDNITKAINPADVAGITGMGYCPKTYNNLELSCINFKGSGFEKACSPCSEDYKIMCNNTCVDALGREQDGKGDSLNHCGDCNTKCNPVTERCADGKCIARCINKCSAEDPNVLQECMSTGEERFYEAHCTYGCVTTETGAACREHDCSSECKDSDTLLICGKTKYELEIECKNGCSSEGSDAKCNECEAKCEEGTLTQCDPNDPLAAATTVVCPLGCADNNQECKKCEPSCAPDGTKQYECDPDNPIAAPHEITCNHGCENNACIACVSVCTDDKTLNQCDPADPLAPMQSVTCSHGCDEASRACNACAQHCSEDGTTLFQCDPDDSFAAYQVVYCDYGCKDNNCVLDSDGDGVPDETDICQNNGKISTGDFTKDDPERCSTYESDTKTFYIYNAHNFIELKALLSTNVTPYFIHIQNDVNFGNLETTETDGQCMISKDPSGITIKGVIIEGHNHTIKAFKNGKRCSLPNALFDIFDTSQIKDLNIDYDVTGSGRSLLINEIPQPSYEETSGSSQLTNITVRGTITTDAEDYESGQLDWENKPIMVLQPVGALVGSISGYIPRFGASKYQTVENCVAKDVRIIAPKSNNVGGLFGYCRDIIYISASEPHRIISVQGNENVGGVIGSGSLNNANIPQDGENVGRLIAEVGSVSGITNVGGYFGSGEVSNAILNIGSVKGGDDTRRAENVAGILGKERVYNPNFVVTVKNIAAQIGKIESNGDNTGLYVGFMDGGSIYYENCYIAADALESTGDNVGMLAGYTQSTWEFNTDKVFAEVVDMKGNNYISGGIGKCLYDEESSWELRTQNTVLRANIHYNDSVYSGISNCQIDDHITSIKYTVSAVTVRDKSNAIKLDNAFFSKKLTKTEDTSGNKLFSAFHAYWYNLGDKANSKPFDGYEIVDTVLNDSLVSFSAEASNSVLDQIRGTNADSTWGTTNFTTIDKDNTNITYPFPAYQDKALISVLNTLHRID